MAARGWFDRNWPWVAVALAIVLGVVGVIVMTEPLAQRGAEWRAHRIQRAEYARHVCAARHADDPAWIVQACVDTGAWRHPDPLGGAQ